MLSISASCLYKAQDAGRKGLCSPSPVKIGKSEGSRKAVKIPNDKLEEVKAHISRFPAESSHYSHNKNPNRKYLHSELNISKMYDLYVKETEEPIKKKFYSDVFNNHFNLGFGSPRSDTCATCDKYKANLTVNEIVEHQEDSRLGYRLMKEDCGRA